MHRVLDVDRAILCDAAIVAGQQHRPFRKRNKNGIIYPELDRCFDLSLRRLESGPLDIVLELASRLQDRLLTEFEKRPVREGAVGALRRAYVVTSTVSPADRDRVLQIGRILGSSRALRIELANDGHRDVVYTLTPNDYEGREQTVTIHSRGSRTVAWPTDADGYYDVIITANTGDGFKRRYAGRIA